MNKVYILAVIAMFALVIPQPAHAVRIGNIMDPLCLFSWRDGCKDNINIDNSINDSFNVNSNINSPGGVVTGNTNNTNTDTDNTNQNPQYDNLYVSCDADESYVETDERVRWSASVSGGTGSYRYDWSGSEGLDGSNESVTIEYDYEGSKNATVRVTSGNQAVTRSCGSILVEDDGRYDDRDDDYYDDYDYYDRPSVYCYSDVSYANTNDRIIWRAYASGGNGRYTYTWSGSDSLSGRGEDVSRQYTRSGTKTASVTVRSNGRSASASCGSIIVSGSDYYTPTYYAPTTVYPSSLSASCSPSVSSAKTGAVITWTVYPNGGNGVYSYVWSGSDGFSGSQKSVVTSYRSTGPKYATVSVYSAGKSTTISCGTTNISASTGKTVVKKPITTIKPAAPKPAEQVEPTSTFNAFDNVPWTFVLLTIIFILFCMVMYLVAKATK